MGGVRFRWLPAAGGSHLKRTPPIYNGFSMLKCSKWGGCVSGGGVWWREMVGDGRWWVLVRGDGRWWVVVVGGGWQWYVVGGGGMWCGLDY